MRESPRGAKKIFAIKRGGVLQSASRALFRWHTGAGPHKHQPWQDDSKILFPARAIKSTAGSRDDPRDLARRLHEYQKRPQPDAH
jgi:hypothetical protein